MSKKDQKDWKENLTESLKMKYLIIEIKNC